MTVDEVDPATAYNLMQTDPKAALIDVRSRAEWAFVGVPDISALGRSLWTIEWVRFPDMAPNENFLAEISGKIGEDPPSRLFFICRSGARSMAAAHMVAAEMGQRGIKAHCTNVAEGFEGDLDGDSHRGGKNGWKARGLPWQQN